MRWLKYTIFLVMLLPAIVQAQYRGSGRPLSRQETLDSLAAKLDTSAVAAGDNVTVDWDGSSLTIASSGGGENWSPADSTLSLDLAYYSNRNVVHLWGVDVYPSVMNYSAGLHGDSTTNFLTDNQSIGVHCPASGSYDGIQFPLPDTNWTKTTDGDTIELAGWYLNVAIRLDSVSQARLPVNGIMFLVGETANTFKAGVPRSSFSEGWNFVKILLSTFGVNSGSPNWADCNYIWIDTYGTQSGDGNLIFLVDNVQLVRGIDGEPNPFQSEGPNGTWTADWTEEGNGNFWIVEESGVIAAMSGDAAVSRIQTTNTYVRYEMSGMTKTASTIQSGFIHAVGGCQVGLGNQILRVLDSTSTWHSKAFAYASGDVIHWKVIRDGTSLTGMVSHDGIKWTAVSTFCNAAADDIRLYPREEGDRYYSIGLSQVEYAAEAGVAQRLKDWFFHIVGDSLQVTNRDSVYNVLINSRRAK